MRRPGVPVPLERDVQASILDWLNLLPGCKAWRQNTGVKAYKDRQGRKRLVKYGVTGQSDVTGLIHGIRLEVEVKRPGKKPTSDQDDWLVMIQQQGGISTWADSLEKLVAFMKNEYQVRGWHWRKGFEI